MTAIASHLASPSSSAAAATLIDAIRAKVQGYIDGVLDGSIPANKWIKLAVKRHLRDLEHGHERGLRFDEKAAVRPIEFCQYVRHSKGEWGGQVFVPEPWQCFCYWAAFGWQKQDSKGRWVRRFKIVYKSVARKNGKSTEAAHIGIYLFCADREPGAEVFTAATKRDQARIVHSEAVRMVKSSPELRRLIGIFKDNLNLGDADPAAKFEPLGADADSMDGLNPNGVIVDELHAHKTRDCWDVLDTATGARRQPMMLAITTAGSDKNTVCGELHDYCCEILDGTRENDSIFAFIAGIDEEDKKNWDDPKVWAKANPNLGISVSIDDLRAKCEKAKAIPSARNAFLRLHLNVWTDTDEVWIPPEKWDLCRGEVSEEELGAASCWGGLDLASKLDLTAFVKVFKLPDKRYCIRPRFWIPAARLQDKRGHDDYGEWVRRGLIETTPGDVTDYDFIEAAIAADANPYSIKEVAFDPWNCTQTANRLKEHHGIKMVEFRQGFVSMNEPSKEFEELVQAKQIVHDGNPVMRWMIGNTSVKTDPSGNIKPVKPEHLSRKKIDGVVAAVMGLGRALLGQEQYFDVRLIG